MYIYIYEKEWFTYLFTSLAILKSLKEKFFKSPLIEHVVVSGGKEEENDMLKGGKDGRKKVVGKRNGREEGGDYMVRGGGKDGVSVIMRNREEKFGIV